MKKKSEQNSLEGLVGLEKSTALLCSAELVIFHFHRKPKRNLGFETELPVSACLFKITSQILELKKTAT